MKRFPVVLSAILMLVSCRQAEPAQRQTIAYVRGVISAPDSYECSVISGRLPDRKDDIVLLGESAECEYFSAELLMCDRHDNVDGGSHPDGLPDFAGETVTSLKDYANAPYSGYLEWRNEEYLRESTVKSVISAVDTVCRLSPYDLQDSGRKSSAKLVVLTSSYNAEYGIFDVDSLFSAVGCRVPVINPLDQMMEEAVKAGASRVGVISTDRLIASGIYSAVFQRKARACGLENPECVAFSITGSDTPLESFLDKYIKAGYDKPLDAILVDNGLVTADRLKEELAFISSVLNPESLTYSSVISGDALILDTRTVISETAYRIFREMNLFSHAIRYPEEKTYLFVPVTGLQASDYTEDGYFSDEFKYSRPAGIGDRTVILIDYSDRFLPAEEYVQD